MSVRADGRKFDELREIRITPSVNPYAEGSALIACGSTEVLITASVEQEVPRWMKDEGRGWITAEYGMLPRATHTRNKREASSGKQGGRTMEIQRLIGRALRAAVDLSSIPGITIRLDCDVMVADGGTRTASISGAWVALAQALLTCEREGILSAAPKIQQIAAISVGSLEGKDLLDLCYEEDSQADFDLNLVSNESGELIEIQGTAERSGLSLSRITALSSLGLEGINRILELQKNTRAALSE